MGCGNVRLAILLLIIAHRSYMRGVYLKRKFEYTEKTGLAGHYVYGDKSL